MAAGQIT
ncbi:hypothetical protein RDI58_013374 [Solanum bulbocastanum]